MLYTFLIDAAQPRLEYYGELINIDDTETKISRCKLVSTFLSTKKGKEKND